MPRIRSEQLQGLTLTDDQFTFGEYTDNHGASQAYDATRLLNQSKVRGVQLDIDGSVLADHQPDGWISRGIINRVEVLPTWQSSYEGRLFYVNTVDELYLGIGTDPWFILISGNTASGWDAELTVRTGADSTDWNGSFGTTFGTLTYNFTIDGSDLFVYLNGNLQRLDHDYTIIDQRTIQMVSRNIESEDTVTMLVHLSNSMLNYATKAWVYEIINAGGIQHSLDAAYDDGSIVSVDTTDVDFRLATDVAFKVTESITGIPLPAVHIGTENMTSGHNWMSRNQSFDAVVRIGGNVVGPNRVTLNTPTVVTSEVAAEISEALVTAGLSELHGIVDNNTVGIQSTATGSDISFDIVSGTNALPVFGLDTTEVTGDDAYSSYHEFGLSVNGADDAGLDDGEKFYFSVNGTEYFITTGTNATYNQIRSSMDTVLDVPGFTVTTEGSGSDQDIRVTTDLLGFANPTVLAGISDAGTIETTQITVNADVDRSLDAKYFTLESIDITPYGHPKEYYAWYHLDAEAEIYNITFTAEDSNTTLANKYFEFHTPSEDFFVWYEVETPQTPGYQELGLTAISGATSSGLIEDTTYYFKVAVDGGSVQEFNFTTAPDIQPTAEITEVTTIADVSQSLSGKYWTINSQTGTGYYVWYNIDTVAASEETYITSIADTAQSLSGTQFSLFTTTQQYYAWLSMMTDPGVTLQTEITEVTAIADSSQSLSGKYFTLNSADGSPYYVWYEMMTDPGVTAEAETTEITAVADVSQSLSGKYFNISSPSVDYYVWFRMMTADAIPSEAEITNVIIPQDVSKSLSGKYWNFTTPSNDYYVWYHMQVTAAIPATAEESTFNFDSSTEADYDGQTFRIYNFSTAYDYAFTTSLGSADTTGLSNPTVVDISSATTATDIATAVAAAVGTPFSATSSSSDAILTCDNVGAQTNAPVGDTNISASISSAGTDIVPAVFSTNPSPASRTGVQVSINENDSNTVVATKTETQLALLPDVGTSLSSATITITNDDNGAVADAANVDAGVIPSVTNQGVTAVPATYSTDPAVSGRTGIQVDISENDADDAIAALVAGELNSLGAFSSSNVDEVITVTAAVDGVVTDATAGDAGVSINITNQGVDYVAPTYSTDPAPGGRTGLKAEIVEDDVAIDVAEALKVVIDANSSFSASRANAVVTITDATQGAVTDAVNIDAGVTINVTQQGQDYVAPTYTTDPIGTGTGIQIDIVENDNATSVAIAIESAINGTAGFSASRIGDTVTVENDVAGVATDAADVDSGFTIAVATQGYEAYSSVDPAVPARTGLQVDIVEDDSADAIAAKTQTIVHAQTHFTASVSTDILTVTDANGGAVADAAVGDSGFSINVTDQGVDLIPADVSWTQILILLEVATTSAATWTLNGGDIRCTSDDIGSWSAIDITSGDSSDMLAAIAGFSALDTAVAGTSSYSSEPGGTGTAIEVPILVGSNAVTVATATQTALDAESGFVPVQGFDVGVDDHIITITNDATGVVTDINDAGGTAFTFDVENQGANESIDPTPAGKTGIQIDIVKDDTAIAVATATQAAIDVGGEFYVSRLNEIISLQNDNPGDVADTADVDTGFIFTQTGVGVDPKYDLFGALGLDITLPAAIDGIDSVPADTGVGTVSLVGGYNFYTFPKDFAVIINGNPVDEVFLDAAVYNSSELVTHVNTQIANAGIANFEAYQVAGYIGFRTTATGSSEVLQLQDSLSDALVTLGWTAGTYTGDSGAANSILEITALTGQNEMIVDADVLPSAHGVHDIGADGNKFKDLYVQTIYADAGTLYLGDAKISEAGNEFAFIVDDGVNTYDFFGNQDIAVAPTGADRIGVDGIIGIIPETGSASPGDPGTLQEMLAGVAKSGGGGKLFPDMTATTGPYGDPTDLKGFLNEKANGLYLKDNEVVMIESLNREIRVLTGGGDVGIVETVDWIWRNDENDAIGGKSIKYDLTDLDANNEPAAGVLDADSFWVKTTGGIKLETGSGLEVQISDDLRVGGDLIVEGDRVEVNVSEMIVEDISITLNSGFTGDPGAGTYAGIDIERGNATNAALTFDEDSEVWRAGIGASTNLDAIALRDDTQTSDGFAYWDNANARYTSSSDYKINGTQVDILNHDLTGSAGNEINGFGVVKNAVWNDIADLLPIDEKIEVEYGKVYVRTVDGQTRKSASYNEAGVLGLASDTYGFGLGEKEDWEGTQLPVAIGGFVLAHVIAEYAPGTPLCADIDGNLVEMRIQDKRDFPERIVATYYKPEPADDWNGVVVNGRHWVKVK